MKRLGTVLLALAIGACGSDDGPGGDDAGPEGPCGFEDRYLPYDVGYSWTWRVTDIGTGAISNKLQTIEEQTSDPTYGEVLVQLTTKATGTTRSLMRLEDSAVVRLVQEDYDMAGNLERTSIYDPGQVRIDEDASRLETGATWEEMYTVTLEDGAGTNLGSTDRTESWEIVASEVECEAPLGTFSCLHVRRQRTVGGIADKQYWFARGVGKVRELSSNQVEELTDCSATPP